MKLDKGLEVNSLSPGWEKDEEWSVEGGVTAPECERISKVSWHQVLDFAGIGVVRHFAYGATPKQASCPLGRGHTGEELCHAPAIRRDP